MTAPENMCQVYGHLKAYKPGATVTLTFDGEPRTIKVCDEHLAFFEDFDPVIWSLGLTYTNEVEIRPIAAQPAPPETPEPPA